MSLRPSYGHIHFAIETKIIAQHANNLRNLIGSFRKMVHTFQHKSTQHRADRSLQRVHLDIEQIIKFFQLQNDCIRHTTKTTIRHWKLNTFPIIPGQNLTPTRFNKHNCHTAITYCWYPTGEWGSNLLLTPWHLKNKGWNPYNHKHNSRKLRCNKTSPHRTGDYHGSHRT